MLLDPGESWSLEFNRAYDFENNNVRLEFAELRDDASVSGAKEYPEWLDVTNSTRFSNCQITITIPED